ncbi:hypothetical protein BJ875DRAFT_378512 [Amylocarpus encephaloides]|uniref:N-acetyltransferase domain-containing protein n=1 Tax=Amylocarpus encephaloides TaxID=45428 RepID=A0A9P8C4S4_9HELO|nr:hypothetical protein BJ875DRAFT_378512 [Amylocarpus encephaloides]
MTFKLHEQTRDDEFAGIIDCENAGYSEPFNGFWEILRGPSAEELTERQTMWHSLDPSSRWLYVTDEATGQVVGAMEWNIYEENPYADGVPDFPADWWPEDSPLRKISDYVLKEFLKDRPHVMGKPHVRMYPKTSTTSQHNTI